MEPEDAAYAQPFLVAYNALVKCRNLGVTIEAGSLDLETLNALHDIQEKLDEMAANKPKER
jgi:hypothetical protein